MTAEKERIGTELQMARQIQEGMLPGTSRRRKHFEYEGYDWRELTALLRKL